MSETGASLAVSSGQWLAVSVLPGLAVGIFLFFAVLCWPFTVDDAYISFRYARNLAQGFGLTFNAAGPHAEGYTNFSWTLLLTLPELLGVQPDRVAKLIGVACSLATVGVCGGFTHWYSRSVLHVTQPWAAALAAVLFAVFPSTAVHAIGGLETPLFTLLLTLFLCGTVWQLCRPSFSAALALAFTGLFLGLTRPEGNLPVLVGLAGVCVALRGPARIRFVGAALIGYLLPGLAYYLWRLGYYGYLFPLPFYLKTVHQSLFAGQTHVWEFTRYIVGYVGLGVVLGLLQMRRILWPALGALAALWVFYLFPAHIMGYNWRLMFPLVPWISIVAALGFGLLHRLLSARWRRPLVPGLVLAFICVLIVGGMVRDAWAAAYGVRGYAASLEAAHIRLGHTLRAIGANQVDPLLAMGDAGAAPYYSGWRTIDTYGLNDPTIAVSGDHDPAYVLQQVPDVLVLLSRRSETFEPLLEWEQQLYDASIRAGFQHQTTLMFDSEFHLWIFSPAESEIGERLAERLR